jgi:hypothetical protein
MQIKKLIYMLVLTIIVLAGCTTAKPAGTTAAPPPGIASATTNPPGPESQTSTPAQAQNTPAVTPTSQLAPETAGWQQYHSADLGITIDYPTGWTAAENKSEVTFTSPGGVNIRLDPIQSVNLSPQDFLDQNQLPNTRCTSGKNPPGVEYRSCFDTIAMSTTAFLVVTSTQAPAKFFTLSTFGRGNVDVFNTMLASFHPS